MSSVLALDLGTTTGFALRVDSCGSVVSGSWKFQPKRHEDAGMRFVRFRTTLDDMHRASKIRVIYFEEVRRHAGTTAAHIYGGFMSHLQAWCVNNSVSYQSVPVGEIKRFWTGHGNAPKDEKERLKRIAKQKAKGKKPYAGTSMVEEAIRRGHSPEDDNEADALAILALKIEGA